MKSDGGLYVVRCQHQPRCGSGQVLLRVTEKGAVFAAKVHTKRTGHNCSVHYTMLRPFYTATPEHVVGFVAPAYRRYDDDPTFEQAYFGNL